MRLRLIQVLSLARLTVLEILRQPANLLLTAGIVIFLGLLPMVVTFQFGETGKLIRDSALAVQWLGGLLLGAHAAGGAVAAEVRRGTVGAILTRPVRRADLLVAKFLGLSAFMSLYALLSSLGVLLSARAAAIAYEIDFWGSLPAVFAPLLGLAAAGLLNYLFQKPFASAAWGCLAAALAAGFVLSACRGAEPAGWAPFGTAFDFRLIPACALIALGCLLMQTVALLLSVRFETVPVLVACFALLLAGLMSDHFLGRHAGSSSVAAVLYAVVPNGSHFWMADALAGGGRIGADFVAAAARYAALQMAAVLALAVAWFDRAEVR